MLVTERSIFIFLRDQISWGKVQGKLHLHSSSRRLALWICLVSKNIKTQPKLNVKIPQWEQHQVYGIRTFESKHKYFVVHCTIFLLSFILAFVPRIFVWISKTRLTLHWSINCPILSISYLFSFHLLGPLCYTKFLISNRNLR